MNPIRMHGLPGLQAARPQTLPQPRFQGGVYDDDLDDQFEMNPDQVLDRESLRKFCAGIPGIVIHESPISGPDNPYRDKSLKKLLLMRDEHDKPEEGLLIELATRYQNGLGVSRDIDRARDYYREAANTGTVGKYWYGVFLLNEVAYTERVPLKIQLANLLPGKPLPSPAQAEAYKMFYMASLKDRRLQEVQDAEVQKERMEAQFSPKALKEIRLDLQKRKPVTSVQFKKDI